VRSSTRWPPIRRERDDARATQIERGPIATIKVPLRLKPAYHGSWADASLIKPAHRA
jgi:hypothetical protein